METKLLNDFSRPLIIAVTLGAVLLSACSQGTKDTVVPPPTAQIPQNPPTQTPVQNPPGNKDVSNPPANPETPANPIPADPTLPESNKEALFLCDTLNKDAEDYDNNPHLFLTYQGLCTTKASQHLSLKQMLKISLEAQELAMVIVDSRYKLDILTLTGTAKTDTDKRGHFKLTESSNVLNLPNQTLGEIAFPRTLDLTPMNVANQRAYSLSTNILELGARVATRIVKTYVFSANNNKPVTTSEDENSVNTLKLAPILAQNLKYSLATLVSGEDSQSAFLNAVKVTPQGRIFLRIKFGKKAVTSQ